MRGIFNDLADRLILFGSGRIEYTLVTIEAINSLFNGPADRSNSSPGR